ncbi:MAG: recombinase family protein [Candidatus Methanomethylophilaceae archaeon]|nr:recombinase family protein [Candidatus Methanomethylophilaceae archaeon]
MKQPYNTALYMRLSRDDENYGDSISIETQRLVLNTYAREQCFYVVDEYVDDGWSGTNFERPGFQRKPPLENGITTCSYLDQTYGAA